MKKIFLIYIFFISFNSYAGRFITNKGFATECPLSGTGSSVITNCRNHCVNRYGTSYNGSLMTIALCSFLGIDSNYTYCCANQAAVDVVTYCTCADPNQITVYDISGGDSYKQTKNTDGSYTYQCYNLYCFCNVSYYGSRQLMSNSSYGACTLCPCVDDTYSTSTGKQLCGWTANNYMSFTNNAEAPSYSITDCKVGPVAAGAVPEAYRTYEDPTGTFVLSNACPYVD